LINELLDKLQCSSFFSKLDIRYGYHQVHIHEGDVGKKIAFQIHQGYYEFKVIPFELINAPTTFQALMNDILESFMRKFILLFFDDILIYISSLETHVNHLKQVLETLKTNQLLAKKSKCTFIAQQVEYLGHNF